MAEDQQINAVITELQNIRAILNQNGIGPVVAEAEVVYQQPGSVDEFIQFAKTDIKNLPIFTGEGFPSLNSWLLDVEPIIETMNRLIPMRYEYHYFLREIKRKIQGNAGKMLENYEITLS